MKKEKSSTTPIPVSVSLNPLLQAEEIHPRIPQDKKRLFFISSLSIVVALCVSVVAKSLVYLIDVITNISFFGNVSFAHGSPANNSLGWWVVAIPVMGGIIIGLMALYGSKAIRGHGIPEAMEQILTNQSRIKPSITYLKPLSSAISIGTGGPFGAEGPIIATGGALGSTLGQFLKITHNERKVLLAGGATAGMSAIFGSPIAAIFLAIELLLFEFSPRSIIPVALACITGAAGHYFLFEPGPVFAFHQVIAVPSDKALLFYSMMGLVIGVLSILVTKSVYFIEDAFERLPIHWMWWPALGGIGVGVVGYFAPRTLGVGYDNIVSILSGEFPIRFVLTLCLLKYLSWAIALGSGTSGGTLAPLLTIGGATGAILGSVVLDFFPMSGITLPLAALVGMSAMFAGASRAFLTSIVFALETTGQSNALLPLLATCTASYFVSFFFMENTIMTEKIARRGVKTPHSYEPDLLEKVNVGKVFSGNGLVLSEENSIREAQEWIQKDSDLSASSANFFIITNDTGEYRGIVSTSNIVGNLHDGTHKLATLVRHKHAAVFIDQSLRTAVETMAREDVDVLAVVSREDHHHIIGLLSYRDIISIYSVSIDEKEKREANISLKRQGLKVLLHGKRLISSNKKGSKN